MAYDPLKEYAYNSNYDIPMEEVFVVKTFNTQEAAHQAGLGEAAYNYGRPGQDWADPNPPKDGVYHAWYSAQDSKYYLRDLTWYPQWVGSANVPPFNTAKEDTPCRLLTDEEIFVASNNPFAPGPRAWVRNKTRFYQIHPDLKPNPSNVSGDVANDLKTLEQDEAKLRNDLGIK